MNRFAQALAAAALTLSAALPQQATAAAFVAWKVTDVSWGDTLNVRKFPASTSQKRAAYPNGTVLSMTGKCTGDVDLFEIADLSRKEQRARIRNEWCQVWHDPKQNGAYELGWVYGRYIRPD
ncbi:MAG TPA: SH3 domain-containing protein [Mesorhizobium sp.]|jgi:hypothetical protein|nr:SH3 domain-containing protein [Mesorhizobium sp.]